MLTRDSTFFNFVKMLQSFIICQRTIDIYQYLWLLFYY